MLRSPILQVRLPSSHIPRVLLTKTWENRPETGASGPKNSHIWANCNISLTWNLLSARWFMMIPIHSPWFQISFTCGPVMVPSPASLAEPPKVTLNHVPKTPPSTNAAAPTKRHGVASPFARRSWGAVKGKERSKAKEMERNPRVAGVSEVDIFELQNLSKTRVYGKYNCSW